jgi:hypothetical protein
MLIDIQNEAPIVIDIDKGLTARLTTRFTAWSEYCSKFYDELVNLIIDTKMILVENIHKASSLITDIQMLSKKVPFEGQLVDMTNDLYQWVALSVRGHVLKDFFAPPETQF